MKQLLLFIPVIIALSACICLVPQEEESNAALTVLPETYTVQTEMNTTETQPQTAPPETETSLPVTSTTEETHKPQTISAAETYTTIAILNTSVEPRTEAPTEHEAAALPVSLYCQYPGYPTGCECAALYMLLDYYGTEVTMEQLADALPKGSLPYEKDGILYGANPEKAFVGDPRNDDSFGVFNGPIAQTANLFREGAVSRTGATLESALAIVDNGDPVIAWYTMDPKNGIIYRRSWLDAETGEKIVWPGNEHAVVITWHDDTSLRYNDPNTGTSVTVEIGKFREIFNELGGRIVYYET